MTRYRLFIALILLMTCTSAHALRCGNRVVDVAVDTDLVQVVDDQLRSPRCGIERRDQVGDPPSGRSVDELVVGQGGAQRVGQMPSETDFAVVLRSHAIPGAGAPCRGQMTEQSGLSRARRTQHKGHGHRPLRPGLKRGSPRLQTVPDQPALVWSAQLFQEDENIHGLQPVASRVNPPDATPGTHPPHRPFRNFV